MGEHEKARSSLGKAVVLFRQQKNYFFLKDALVDIADVELEDRRYDEAETYLREAVKVVGANQPDENALPVLIKYGELMIARGNPGQAKTYLSKAEELAMSLHRKEYLASIYHQLASVYAREGNMVRYDGVMLKYREVMDTQLKAKLTSTYDQMRNFYEIDLLNREKIQLEEGIKNRNRQLIFTWVALLLILTAGAVIFVQNIKLNRFVRTLFRLNVEEFRQYVQADHPTSVGREAVDLTQSKELSTLPSFDRYQSIITILESEKLYLSPDFTLQELSTRLASNQKYISQAINEHSGTNFNGLVNRYRVQEARKLILSSSIDQAINLNDVAFRSGFNNRVSFYRNFKEETGFTPSEFLKMSRSKVLGN
jgi:YesN/AraC family two-component response regulator